jgi:hypothetical protein
MNKLNVLSENMNSTVISEYKRLEKRSKNYLRGG